MADLKKVQPNQWPDFTPPRSAQCRRSTGWFCHRHAHSGLGYACAASLGSAGVDVILNGRSEANLSAAVETLSKTLDRQVTGLVADVSTRVGRSTLMARCPDPDILVNNTAGPPPGQFENWDEETWQGALNSNMVAPIMLIRATIGRMRRQGWGRIINITSGAVKAPLPLLGLSNGARSGLTGFVAGLAREVARDGVTINNILPGHFATDRLRSYTESLGLARGTNGAAVWKAMEEANPAGRFGRPEEFGAMCAFIASDHAGYVNGQNILMDGGAYPGTF